MVDPGGASVLVLICDEGPDRENTSTNTPPSLPSHSANAVQIDLFTLVSGAEVRRCDGSVRVIVVMDSHSGLLVTSADSYPGLVISVALSFDLPSP